jgi:hypothetical protein
MALRTAILATAFFGTLATFYHLSSSSSSTSQTLFTMSPNQPPLSDVAISLSPAQSLLTVKVTIRNDSPDKPFSFLSWDSPFDPQAINTGVLCLKDAESGDTIDSPGMKLNRMLPPPRDELVEIAPGSSATKELTLKSPWIPTDGKKYRLHLRGNWRAAWAKAAADVSDGELEAMGSEGAESAFESDSLEMQLKE